MVPTTGVDGAAATVIVTDDDSSSVQFEGATPVAKILNVVVVVKFPVGRIIVAPVPGTGTPTEESSASFLNW